MKKVVCFWAVLPALVLGGCASTGRDFSAHRPLALVSVVSNYDINWEGEETIPESGVEAFVRGALNMRRDESKTKVSKADELITDAEAILREVLTEAGIFEPVDREETLHSPAYAAGESERKPRNTDLAAAAGYRFINYRDKNFAAALSRETGARSLLFVSFNFTKAMTSGFGKNGKCQAKTSMTAILTGGGKVIYRKTFECAGPGSIAVSGGAYSHEELLEAFRETVTEAAYRFMADFSGPGPGA